MSKIKLSVKKGDVSVKPLYKDMETKFDSMLEGNLENLPPLARSTVKIFVSSTFSDMKAERNALLSHVVPELKKFCSQLDLDFQMVDLRWGLTEDVQNDHSAEKLCLQEIENCQNVSLGPNFISILSHRYGSQCLPSSIAVSEFENLRDEAKRMKLDQISLLDKWYLLDENCIPSMYVLQPIRRHFKYFGDRSTGVEDKRSNDTADWWKTQTTLQNLLCQTSESLHSASKLSAVEKHKYFQSVTEREIEKGIFQVKNIQNHALFYHRCLTGLNKKTVNEENANKYIAVTEKNGETVINQKLADFIENCVKKAKSKLGETNSQTLTTVWKPGGINPQIHLEHTKYIRELCQLIVSKITALVIKARSDRSALIRVSEYYSDLDEIVHHLRFCNEKCEAFCGQSKILSSVKDYIFDTSVRFPLIIHADSGAGKTSVMAMVMKKLSFWTKGEYVGVIRFLGTSPESINIYDVLFGVCGQLADAADLIMEPVGYKNIESLAEYMPRFLRNVASTLKKPIVIILDSIDQLSSESDAHSMWWMPTALPANVKLVISTLPKEHGILDNIKKKLPAEHNSQLLYLQIPQLPQSTGEKIMKKFLNLKKRTLTQQQFDLLLTTFAKCAYPLYLKLLLDEAVKWGSYTPAGELAESLAPSVQAAINLLFDRLEKKFGVVLVKGALGYITVGLNGLSEIELEDVLSCDDTVLDDVYAFHDPPSEGIVRIPSMLWARIRFDIREYLVERLSEGKTTLCWYHRQFVETARDRYVHGKNSQFLHHTLFDIYLAEGGIKKDIFLSKRNKLISSADRQVTSQPLTTENLRKLKCLTYHLIHASPYLESSKVKEHVFCNLKFLCTKISALSTNHVVKDMDMYLDKLPDEEITEIRNFLRDNRNNLKNSVILASSLLGYISPRSDKKYIVRLLQSAKAFLLSQKKPILVPTFACLASTAVESVIIGGYCSVLCINDNKLLLHGNALDDLDRYAHWKLANGAQKTEQLATYHLDSHSIQKMTSEFTPYLGLLFDLQLNKKSIKDSYKTILQNSLLTHAVSASRLFACITCSHGNVFLLKVHSNKQNGFQCLTHLKTSSDVSIVDIHCADGDDSVSVMAVCRSNKEEIPDQVLIWRAHSDGFFDNKSSDPVSVLSKYTTKDASSIFETQSLIPKAEVALQERPEKRLSYYSGENLFVCVCSNGNVAVIDVDIGEVSRSMQVGRVQNICGSGKLMLIHNDNGLKLFDITDGSVICTMSTVQEITSVNVLWEDKIVLTGHSDGLVTALNVNTGERMVTIPVISFCVSKIHINNFYVIFASDMHSLCILTKKYILEQSKLTSDKTCLGGSTINDFCFTQNGQNIVTSTYGCLRIWSLDGSLIREFPAEGRLYNLYKGPNNMVLGFDKVKGILNITDIITGTNMFGDLLTNVIALTLNDNKSSAYALCMDKNLLLYHIDIKTGQTKKLFAFLKNIIFETVSITLSASNRYLVVQVGCTEKDYDSVKAMWKKGGQYPTQPHPHKFLAVDLTQTSGLLFSCLRPLTKIPHLGILCAPYRGNVVLLTVKRHVIFWDIPTGKCDQWMSKGKKLVMFYRADWTGGDKCSGANTCLVLSKDNTFIAAGSEDGYLFIYSSETGLPVGLKAPSTRHPSMVTHAAIAPSSKFVASVCHSGVLKLWNPKAGVEVFSIQLGSSIRNLEFTADSRHLVVCTSPPEQKLFMFFIHDGNAV